MSTREQLLEEMDAFLSQTGMKKSVFGARAANDDKFVGRVRSGSGFTVQTLDKVRQFMREYRPPAAPKDGKPRPKHQSTVAA